MPFSVPKKWFDMFPLDSIQLPPSREDDLNDVPPRREDGWWRSCEDPQSGRWKEAVQAYLATIAYCDWQSAACSTPTKIAPAGQHHRLPVERSRLEPWEKSHWRKFALWEEPTRTFSFGKCPA
jgi:hypothetical protein